MVNIKYCGRFNIFFTLVILLVILLAGCDREYANFEGKIMKGQSRQDIIAILGNPYETKIIMKSNQFIWGPEEDFWDQIPMASRLEVWNYKFSDGQLNLYFANEGETLDFIAYAPAGVVY